MPKTLLLALALVCLSASIAGCNKNTATSAVVTTPAPVPTGTTSLVTALYQGSPLVGQAINLYNTNGSTTNPQPSGAAIATQTTNASGQTTFTGLTSGAYYCFQFQHVVNASTTVTQTYCGNAWAAGVTLGS